MQSGVDVYDARGATIIPGLIDAHGHVFSEGYRLMTPWVWNATSEEAVVDILVAWVDTHAPLTEGEWLIGGGWDQTKWNNNDTFPTRESLDAAFPDTPVSLERYDGHAVWANTAALKGCAPLPADDPPGGVIVRDEVTGEPTGVFVDNAMSLVEDLYPPKTAEEKGEALTLALQEFGSLGVTGVADMGVSADLIESLYKPWAEAGNLTSRIYAHRLGVAGELGPAGSPSDEKLRGYGAEATLTVEGVKFFMDGALGSWGAALLQPYSDKPNSTGTLRMTAEAFAGNASAWATAGWQIATHAIGDRANRIVLDSYEAILEAGAGEERRFRIEHSQILDSSADLGRFAKLGVIPSMQPTHAMEDMGYAADRLGDERLEGAYAWRSMLDSGVLALPFGSDFPVEPVQPMYGIYSAVTRQYFDPSSPNFGTPAGGWRPEERVSREAALRGFTLDAAFAAFMEDDVGTIETGKRADFVLLDRDIMTVDADAIVGAEVLATFMNGREVWKAGDPNGGRGGPNSEPHSAVQDL